MHDHPDTMYTIATARHREDLAHSARVHEARRPGRVRQRWRLMRRREDAATATLAPSAILAR